MNARDAYYKYQASARGLTSLEAVEKLAASMELCYRRLLPQWLPADRKAQIYEVACGPGIMLRYLRKQGYIHALGSDSSASQIELAQAAGLPAALEDSLAELKKHEAGRWDCLIAIDFIEHLPKDLLVEFFIECNRVLKANGCLILRAPNGDSPFVGRNLFNDITHFWAYTTVAMEALLKMAGFGRVEFAEESMASIGGHRWIKAPVMRCAQALLRVLIRTATREQVRYFNPSLYVAAWKKHE